MRGMGRKRTKNPGLPKYVEPKRGWYVWRRDKLGLGPPIRLVPKDSPMSAVWAAWEDVQEPDRTTLAALLSAYVESAERSPRTQKDYRAYVRLISSQKLADGRTLGEIDPDEPTTLFWRHYMDRQSDTPVAANRRMQFIKAAYAWAFERGRVKAHTPQPVRLFREKARQRYVTQAEYGVALEVAREWAAAGRYPYLWVMMELAYLLRARRSEVTALMRRQVGDGVIRWDRAKGSRGEVTRITPRLKAAIDGGKALESDILSQYIVHRKGQRIRKNAFDSAWRRLMNEVEARGVERFTFHDLKAAGISDHEQHYSGHKSDRQRGDYIRKPDEVDATR